jgi:hypothetical protein
MYEFILKKYSQRSVNQSALYLLPRLGKDPYAGGSEGVWEKFTLSQPSHTWDSSSGRGNIKKKKNLLAGALKVVMICVLQDSLDLW